MARAIRRVLGSAPSWRIFATASFAIAFALFGALLTATGSRLPLTAIALPMVAMVLLGIGNLLAAKSRLEVRWLQLQLLAMVGVVSFAVFSAGPLQTSLFDLFLLPVVCAAYAIEGKHVHLFVLGSLGLLAAAVLTVAYPFAIAAICVNCVVTLIACGLLVKARKGTRQFAEQAVDLTIVDPLTGLSNLRGMRRTMVETREMQPNAKLALIGIDLDEFKLVNDVHSHSLGDKVLVAVAEAMRSVVREGDLIARRGGDEFVIMCHGENELELKLLTHRLIDSIVHARINIVVGISPLASISTTVWHAAESVDGVLERVDEDLHNAKMRSRHSADEVQEHERVPALKLA